MRSSINFEEDLGEENVLRNANPTEYYRERVAIKFSHPHAVHP